MSSELKPCPTPKEVELVRNAAISIAASKGLLVIVRRPTDGAQKP